MSIFGSAGRRGRKKNAPCDLLVEVPEGLKVLDGRRRVLNLDVGRGAVWFIGGGEEEVERRGGKKSGREGVRATKKEQLCLSTFPASVPPFICSHA